MRNDKWETRNEKIKDENKNFKNLKKLLIIIKIN